MSKAICSVKTPGCTYLGINATEKISGILEKENAKKVIVLTDRGVYDTQKIQDSPDWEMAGIYADEGITGTSLKK